MKALHVAPVLLFAVLLSVAASPAYAASSGVLKGKLAFYQFNGGYCPGDGRRSCTGARYLESEYKTVQPIRDVLVHVTDVNTGTVLGESVTNSNTGEFTISWHTNTTQASFTATIGTNLVRQGAFFYITETDGVGFYELKSPNFTLTSGTTASAPQNKGTVIYGNSTAGNVLTDLYHALWLAWRYAIGTTSVGMEDVVATKVLAFGPFSECGVAGSCGGGNEIRLAFDTMHEILTPMHEFGHILSQAADGHKASFDYCYPDTCTPSTTGSAIHGSATSEWLSAAFEEGFADMVPVVALHTSAAIQPYLCRTTSFCLNGAYDYETNGVSCDPDQGRHEINLSRFLWDLYDTHSDAAFSETAHYTFDSIVDILSLFPVGTGDHQNNEPWNAALTAWDARDGRSVTDYIANGGVVFAAGALQVPPMTSANTIKAQNCLF